MGARKTNARPVPFVDMRSVITLARQGEQLAGRLARDVQALVFSAPAGLVGDVRTRADAAVRDIEERGALVVGAVERQIGRVSALVFRRFSAATQDEIDALDRRIATLEKRLGSMERRRRKARRPSL